MMVVLDTVYTLALYSGLTKVLSRALAADYFSFWFDICMTVVINGVVL